MGSRSGQRERAIRPVVPTEALAELMWGSELGWPFRTGPNGEPGAGTWHRSVSQSLATSCTLGRDGTLGKQFPSEVNKVVNHFPVRKAALSLQQAGSWGMGPPALRASWQSFCRTQSLE